MPFRDSYFAAKINKICHENLSLEIKALQERVGPLCGSLPHVLLYKERIFRSIIDFINNEAHRNSLRDAVGYGVPFYFVSFFFRFFFVFSYSF